MSECYFSAGDDSHGMLCFRGSTSYVYSALPMYFAIGEYTYTEVFRFREFQIIIKG